MPTRNRIPTTPEDTAFEDLIDNRDAMRAAQVNQHVYITFTQEDMKESNKDLYVTPFEPGTVVYFVGNRVTPEIKNPGKIIRIERRSNYNPVYIVEFILTSKRAIPHSELIPSKDWFDHMVSTTDNVYIPNFDVAGFVSSEDYFISVSGYLYNKDHTIILEFVTFNKFFTKRILK